MGIDIWEKRHHDLPMVASCNVFQTLQSLEQQVAKCARCVLHQTRKQTVFSRGNPESSLMVIGEAPGFHEDQQGKPFIGKAGMLLDRMLQSIDIQEHHFYVANVIKCRPPDNRDPQPEEIQQCKNYLLAQIAAIKPKVIFAVGRFAGQSLLNSNVSIAQLRKNVHYYQSIPVVVSYHPAYLLRNPIEKKKTYHDLLKLRQLLLSASPMVANLSNVRD